MLVNTKYQQLEFENINLKKKLKSIKYIKARLNVKIRNVEAENIDLRNKMSEAKLESEKQTLKSSKPLSRLKPPMTDLSALKRRNLNSSQDSSVKANPL